MDQSPEAFILYTVVMYDGIAEAGEGHKMMMQGEEE